MIVELGVYVNIGGASAYMRAKCANIANKTAAIALQKCILPT